jgi:hypothetical protein
MTWRWVWARAQLTGVVASALVWLVLAVLAPLFVAAYGLLAVAVVAGWSTWPVLWWRYGARRLGSAEAEGVWRALVPVEWLRGRNQPRLWVGSRVDADVVAADPQQLVLSERLVAHLARHEVSDRDVCRLVVCGFGLVEVNRSRLVAAVEVFCAPWALLAIVASTLAGPVAGRRLVGFGWRIRWLFVVLAAIDLYGRGQWPGLVMLVLLAAATVTAPRWSRAWAVRRAEMTARRDRPGTDAARGHDASTSSVGTPVRPAVGRGGRR